jgi:hypothetical protein
MASTAPTSPGRRASSVTPKNTRRRPSANAAAMTPVGISSSTSSPKLSHDQALDVIRTFLNSQSSYDVFPVSFRLIVLDSMLVVKKAVAAMLQNSRLPTVSWRPQETHNSRPDRRRIRAIVELGDLEVCW